MRPGQIPLTAEPAYESVGSNVHCPTCGTPCQVDAAACANCGSNLPAKERAEQTCPLCHQTKSVDSLTGRCTRCQPVQLAELPEQFQAYASSYRSQNYKQLIIGLLIGPVLIAIYFFYASRGKTGPPWVLWAIVIVTLFFVGRSVFALTQRPGSLQRYHRLVYVMQHVTPVDAELQYDVIGAKYGSRHFFKVCQVGPGSQWPDSLGQKFQIDIPPNYRDEVFTLNFWKTAFAGYDPMNRPKRWGKVYFDPDQSGSAVICVQDRLFLRTRDDRPPSNLFE